MPSATFFRLPEEKRQRLTDAAWAEMLSVRFDKVSINRIIQNAGISRGSFYQYFSDKQDLLHFLFEQIHDELRASALPPGGEGDWLAACLAGYDWVVERRADPRLRLSDVIRFAQINPEMDLPLRWTISTAWAAPCRPCVAARRHCGKQASRSRTIRI